MFFGGKTVCRMSCLERKNGRFMCKPSVLRGTLGKAAKEQKNNCSAIDFLLLLFFLKEKKG